ncbi:unnamed protein product [marine sediment metagenome]|uniref:Uncharacterized protein n=1 Tax=marine sediment metagenome TaxID=412755 RepID=X1HQC3_9ZZZZ
MEQKEISTRTGRIVLVELTRKGSNLLEELGYDAKNMIRQFGLLHGFWRNKVKRHYEKLGYILTSEKKLNGERADLIAEKAGEKIAIEIETSKSDAIRNIRKCLLWEFDLVIVPTNKKSEGGIKSNLIITNLGRDSRVFMTAADQFL